jgi:hypothetical protein
LVWRLAHLRSVLAEQVMEALPSRGGQQVGSEFVVVVVAAVVMEWAHSEHL